MIRFFTLYSKYARKTSFDVKIVVAKAIILKILKMFNFMFKKWCYRPPIR